MASPPKPSLMSIPPELRLRIFEHVFEEAEAVFKPQYVKKGILAWSCAPGILLTCRQTYSEATGIYYKHTAFLAPTAAERDTTFSTRQKHSLKYLEGGDVRVLVQWLKQLPVARRQQIRHVYCGWRDVSMAHRAKRDSYRSEVASYLQNKLHIARGELAHWGITLADGVLQVGSYWDNEAPVWSATPVKDYTKAYGSQA